MELWKVGRGHARSVLRDIVEEHGEAFVIGFLEDRLSGADGPIEKGDMVEVLARQPGQEGEPPGYLDEMVDLEGSYLAVDLSEGDRILAGGFWWSEKWLKKVEKWRG